MAAEIYFCDICNSSIPLKDIESGRAVIKEGKTFCAACRPGRTISPEELKIYFCDSCNGSISIPDIKSNRATFVDGKLFCNRCKPLELGSKLPFMVPSKPPSAVEPSWTHRHGGIYWALFLLFVFSAAVALFGPEIRSFFNLALLKKNHEPLSALEERNLLLANMDRKIDSEISAAFLAEVKPKLEQLEEASEERFKAFIEEKNRFLGELDLYKRFIEIQAKNFDTLSNTLNRLEKDFLRLKDNYEDLSWDLTRIAENIEQMSRKEKEGLAKGGGEVPAQEDEEAQAYLNKLLNELKDRDPSVRYNAVVNLTRWGDPKAIPALIEVLENDKEFVVRKFAAQALGKIGDNSAIPHLIKALDDPDESVSASAIVALQRITGIFQKVLFEEGDSLKAQEEAVKEWKKWWARQKGKNK